MSAIFGILGIDDNYADTIGSLGEEVVYSAAQQAVVAGSAEVTRLFNAFVEKETEAFHLVYLLPGGGRLQRLGEMTPADAQMRYNEWEVEFPLRPWGTQLAWSRRAMAHMSMQTFDTHLDSLILADLFVVRARILTAIFEDDNLTFTDPIHTTADLTIRRLANTDGSLYPPIVGSETDADGQHYLETGYTVANIVDGDSPIVDTRDEVLHHFGGRGNNDRNFVYFHGTDQTDYLAALTDYVRVPDQYIRSGEDTAVPFGLPDVPGRIHGRCQGGWLSEWAWMPDTYGIGLLLEVPAPLIKRVDPAWTGLGTGLHLVATEENYPLTSMHWEHVFGFGCGNRLSACVIEVSGEDGSYTPPTTYAE